MGLLIRAFAALNSAREWFSFANDTVNFFSVAKRAAAAGAAVATIAAPVVMLAQQPAPSAQVAGAQAPGQAGAADAEGGLEKIGPGNIYSKLFLEQPERRALLEAILAKCKAGNDLPAAQCDVAVAAKKSVVAAERQAGIEAALERIAREQEQQKRGGGLKLPHEQTLVK